MTSVFDIFQSIFDSVAGLVQAVFEGAQGLLTTFENASS